MFAGDLTTTDELITDVDVALEELKAMEQDVIDDGNENFPLVDLVESLVIFSVHKSIRAEVARCALGYVPTWAK